MPIQNNYPLFENNQVLTADQLNELAVYLDEQTRISRSFLLGTGIVCGLYARLSKAESKVFISSGSGITSEGFLLSSGECEFTHFRNYSFPDGVKYPPFMGLGAVADITIYELLTDVSAAEPGVSLLNAFPVANWDTMVAVLYLEAYDKDLKSCLGKSCDEIGKKRIFTLRKLLISRADMDKVIARNIELSKPNRQKHLYFEQFNLPQVHLLRPQLSPEIGNYQELLQQYLIPSALAFHNIIDACKLSYEVFELLLKKDYDTHPFNLAAFNAKISDIESHFADLLSAKISFQYLWDFLDDLICAYEEFRCAASNLKNRCLPSEYEFPMHLMLGEISCPPSVYRQHFVSSPILNEQSDWNEDVRTLYKRIVSIISAFDLNVEDNSKEKGILVTPSLSRQEKLGKRAIPVYYQPYKTNEFGFTLDETWNPDICLPCRLDTETNSGYNAQVPFSNQNAPLSPVETPWHFGVVQFPFFRIEGYLGMLESEVRDELLKQDSQFNMGLDLITAWIGSEPNNVTLECSFADLETDYAVWRHKMRYFLNNIVKLTKKAENISGLKQTAKTEFTGFSFKSGDPAVAESIASPQDAGLLSMKMSVADLTDNSVLQPKSAVENSMMYKVADLSERINRVDPRLESEAQDTTSDEDEVQNRIIAINECLLSLIADMPDDFENFDFEVWCDAYRCAMVKYVSAMRYVAGRINASNSNEQLAAFYMALYIAYFVDEVLNFLLIYPYITIATLEGTRQRRLKTIQNKNTFKNILKNNSGLEHRAGVPRGGTFVLIAVGEPKGKYSGIKNNFEVKNNFVNNIVELFDKVGSDDGFMELTKELQGRVVGDLSGYVCCNNECSNVDIDSYHLIPIAFPVTRVVTENNGVYPNISIQLLNNVYDPERYKPTLLSEAKYGVTEFADEDYVPEPGKFSSILQYNPAEEKIRKVKKSRMLVDRIEYGIEDVESGEIISKSQINIFLGKSVTDIKDKPQNAEYNGRINFLPSITAFRMDRVNVVVDGAEQAVNINQNTGDFQLSLHQGTHEIGVNYDNEIFAESHVLAVMDGQTYNKEFVVDMLNNFK